MIWRIAAVVAAAALSTKTGRQFIGRALRNGLHAGYTVKVAAESLKQKVQEREQKLIAERKEDEEKAKAAASN